MWLFNTNDPAEVSRHLEYALHDMLVDGDKQVGFHGAPIPQERACDLEAMSPTFPPLRLGNGVVSDDLLAKATSRTQLRTIIAALMVAPREDKKLRPIVHHYMLAAVARLDELVQEQGA